MNFPFLYGTSKLQVEIRLDYKQPQNGQIVNGNTWLVTGSVTKNAKKSERPRYFEFIMSSFDSSPTELYNSLRNGCVGCISKVENWAVVRTFWPRFRLLFKQDGYSILSVTFGHHVFVVYPLKVFLKNVYLSDSKWISIMYKITVIFQRTLLLLANKHEDGCQKCYLIETVYLPISLFC